MFPYFPPINSTIVYTYYKIGISDAGTPQPDRDLDAETLVVKL